MLLVIVLTKRVLENCVKQMNTYIIIIIIIIVVVIIIIIIVVITYIQSACLQVQSQVYVKDPEPHDQRLMELDVPLHTA